MALPMARQLAALAFGCSSRALVAAAAPAAATSLGRSLRSYSSGAFTRKDVIYNLGNTSDPEAEAAIKAFQREQFAAAAKGPAGAAAAEQDQELAAKLERKYMAAQIVESGIQNVAVPLSDEADGGLTAVKRYLAQLQDVGAQAGFAAPAAELDAKLTDGGHCRSRDS
jgi:hypothetical protein